MDKDDLLEWEKMIDTINYEEKMVLQSIMDKVVKIKESIKKLECYNK